MINADYIYSFINRLNIKDISVFIFFVILISLILKIFRALINWLSKKFPSKRMFVFAWVPITHFILYFGGLFVSFYIIFQPSRELLIGFIVSGFLSLGLAAKDASTSIMAGFFLLTDKPFQIGDRITFQEHYGEILEIGLHSVKLLTLDKSVVTIPNNRFLTDSVKSNSAGDVEMMTSVDVHVHAEADLYKIKKILHHEAEINQYVDTKSKIIIISKELLGGNGVVYFLMTLKCLLKDARLEKAFQTDFLLSVNKKFKINGIRGLNSI